MGYAPDNRREDYDGDLHVILVGGSGRGKTTRYWVPWIISDKGSILAETDVAAELSMLCGNARAAMSEVWIDNPHGIMQSHIGHLPHGCNNPAATLIPGSKKFGIKSMKLAAGHVVIDPHATQKYWQHTAQTGLKAVIMAKAADGEDASLVAVAEEVHRADFLESIANTCEKFSKRQGLWAREIVSTLSRYTTAQEQSVKSILEVVEQMRTDTDFELDEGVAMNLTRDDFRTRDARRKVMSIFRVLGIDVIEVLGKYFRLHLTSDIAELMDPDIEGDKDVTFYCDEYGIAAHGGLESMSVLFGAGRKGQLQACISVLDLDQLQKIHHDWSTLLASAGAVIFMCPITDPITADFVSRKCGETEVYTSSLNSDRSGRNRGPSEGFGRASRRLITPAELAALDEDDVIVFTEFTKGRPMKLKSKPYWEVPELRDRVGKNKYYER